MSDLIDRQAAVDALDKLDYTPGEWVIKGLTMCKDVIKAVPSAETEHDKFLEFLWNKINPNKMEEYLAMFNSKGVATNG